MRSPAKAKNSIRSMTGYGRGIARSENCHLQVELRAVNSRFLDLRAKLPRILLAHENKARELLSKEIKRGAVDFLVTLLPGEGVLAETVNEKLATAYSKKIEALAKKLGTDSGLSALALLRLPGVVSAEEASDKLSAEELWATFSSALKDATAALLSMRNEEGLRLVQVLHREVEELEAALAQVKKVREGVNERYFEKLQARLSDTQRKTNLKLDETRLLQEVIFYADRSDVIEETDRLQSHITELKHLLEGEKNESVGKRLDFLVQEMTREVNTIGSKSDILEVTKLVITMKTAIERLREQVQNIE